MFQSWTLIAQVWSQGKCINILAWPKQCGKYAGWEVITSISWHLSHNDGSNYNWAQKPSQEYTTEFLAWVKGTSQWLKRNNSLYQDIIISDEHLWLLPVDAISHQVLETVQCPSNMSVLEQERSGYVIANENVAIDDIDQEYEIGIHINSEGEFIKLFG